MTTVIKGKTHLPAPTPQFSEVLSPFLWYFHDLLSFYITNILWFDAKHMNRGINLFRRKKSITSVSCLTSGLAHKHCFQPTPVFSNRPTTLQHPDLSVHSALCLQAFALYFSTPFVPVHTYPVCSVFFFPINSIFCFFFTLFHCSHASWLWACR